MLTASACLPENRLGVLAGGLKKAVTWCLTTALLAFTLYLSAVRVVSGRGGRTQRQDGQGGHFRCGAGGGRHHRRGVGNGPGRRGDAAKRHRRGGDAGNSRGLRLSLFAAGVQYLIYKLTAFLAAMVGPPGLCRLIDGLGGAFGLVLGMTGACALLLLISLLAFVGAVVP